MREHHKKLRLTYSMEKMTWKRSQWDRIVWSDKKKFNLDGTDGPAYKWHDFRMEKKYFSKRHSGGGSIMVWFSLAGSRTSSLVRLSGSKNGVKYVDILGEHLLPFADDPPLNWKFMQDGAPCLHSLVVKSLAQRQLHKRS